MKFDVHLKWFEQLNFHDPNKNAVALLMAILGDGAGVAVRPYIM